MNTGSGKCLIFNTKPQTATRSWCSRFAVDYIWSILSIGIHVLSFSIHSVLLSLLSRGSSLETLQLQIILPDAESIACTAALKKCPRLLWYKLPLFLLLKWYTCMNQCGVTVTGHYDHYLTVYSDNNKLYLSRILSGNIINKTEHLQK